MLISSLNFVLVGILLQACGLQCASFPSPRGPYGVSTTPLELIDISRNDPGALQFSNITTPRALMISVFLPLRGRQCKDTNPILYFPAITAAFEDGEYGVREGTFGSLNLPGICKSVSKPLSRHFLRSQHGNFPVLAFSPGFGTTRLLYSSLASSIASYGYVVVTIDHPYDVDIVEFLDKRTVISPFLNVTNEATLISQAGTAQDTRAADISFTLDQLALPSMVKKLGLSPGYGIPAKGIDVSKVGVFGHSFGGAAALVVMERDKRVRGAINLDGYIYGPPPSYVPTTGVSRSFVLVGSEGNNRTHGNNFFVESWGAFWNESSGSKLELEIIGAQHYDFSDFPLVLDITNQTLSPDLADTFPLGTIGGLRAREVISAYVRAFFDHVLKGEKEDLLKRKSRKYPEVTFVD